MAKKTNKKENTEVSATKSSYVQAKERLASRPETSPDTLKKLGNANSPDLQERVAENSNTESGVLEKLASSDSAQVRSAVTENQNTSTEILQQLAGDEHPDVRFRLAENPNTPIPILESLAGDENPFVSTKASSTLESLKGLSEQADEALVQERFPEAERLYKHIVMDLEVLFGPDNHKILKFMHKLAATLQAQGKESEAVNIAERAKRIEAAYKEL